MSPKILYVSPNKDFSGYATAARDYILALNRCGANIVTRTLNYDGAKRKLTKEEEELQGKDLRGVDIVLQHTTPIEMTRKEGLFNIGYFAWETDTLPKQFAEASEQMDLLLMPCEENIKAARRAGVRAKIERIPHTFNTKKYNAKLSPFILNGIDDNKFKFLCIMQMSKKKGLDSLLRAYFAEFSRLDNVVLILKIYIGPNDGQAEKNNIVEMINKIKEGCRLGEFPPIMLLHDIMDEDIIPRLYKSADCYVLPSRGEGWSITAFDALGYGLPVIATNWAGPSEFLDSSCGWPVNYTMSPCFGQTMGHSFMYTAKEKWAEPDLVSLMSSMREAYQAWNIRNSNPIWNGKIAAAKERVKKFDYSIVGPYLKNIIEKNYMEWLSVH